MKNDYQLIITCEHAGYDIPAPYAPLFASSDKLLKSHRGYDPGALDLAKKIAAASKAPFHFTTISRLLIECNRSLHSRQLFSSITQNLSSKEKQAIIDRVYTPYRSAVEADINRFIQKGRTVLHLSVHTFTPKLGDDVRKADIGLLYDPRRPFEKECCSEWRHLLKQKGWHVRLNYPYLGRSDGFATYLRSLYSPEKYLGIELEVNQKFPLHDATQWRRLQEDLINTFAKH